MKIVEIQTFSPNELKAYDPHPLSPRVDRDTSQRISNALTGPAFVIDPVRLRPEVPWPGESVRDTVAMPIPSGPNPTLGAHVPRPLSNPTTAVRPRQREPLFMPLRRRSVFLSPIAKIAVARAFHDGSSARELYVGAQNLPGPEIRAAN